MNILQINSSIRAENAYSSRLADSLVAGLRQQAPAVQLAVRDLAKTPHPLLDEAALIALSTPAEQRNPAQAQRVALDDALIAEIQQADVVVLTAPMYNFGIPAQLKAWIDAIARARVTFQYTENGVEGLLKNKQVFVIQTAGGKHSGTETDSQSTYLRTVLGFLGMTDVTFIYAEGLAMGGDAEQLALQAAASQIAALAA
ncbi:MULTISPECIES: FMN-dependent NADH-azoreductase [Methylomonas]|uniref:FMN dependent NADH:quinone oxidoreductase n=2 Tax=Methylomonas TaxID=416 RepID=A0A126T6H7_9GAMM|nr:MULTISPECIES: NAD(P)H-dependent oxidoreductase [Methylomonas]AMK77658.1 FMN-dependent NADH-azoreductase [Methylomonas denitrificans]OAH96847.1 FMN-dependent NADH-azoreductase [Methylomonas methanica]TCV86828.1 FMN-dependent NADH-azoreductase [Methylomonas methanica]